MIYYVPLSRDNKNINFIVLAARKTKLKETRSPITENKVY